MTLKQMKRKKRESNLKKKMNKKSNRINSHSNFGNPTLHSSGIKVYQINLDTLDVIKFSNKKFRNRIHDKPFIFTEGGGNEIVCRYNKNVRGFEMGHPFPFLPTRDVNKGVFSPHITNTDHKIPLMNEMTENEIPNNWRRFTEHLKEHDVNHCKHLCQNMSTGCQCYFISVGLIFGLMKMGIKKEFKFTQGLIYGQNEITGMSEGVPNTWVEDSDGLVYDMSMSGDEYGDVKLSSPEEYNDKYWGCPNHVYYEKRHIIPETVNSYSLEEVLYRRRKEGVLYLDTKLLPSGGLNDIVFLDHKGEEFYYPTLEEIEEQILLHNKWVSLPQKFNWLPLLELGRV